MKKKTKQLLSVLAMAGTLFGSITLVQSYCDAREQAALEQITKAGEAVYNEDQEKIYNLEQQLQELQKKYDILNDKAYLDSEKVKWLEDDYNKLLEEHNNLLTTLEQRQNAKEVSQGEEQGNKTIANAKGVAHRFTSTAYGDDGSTMTATGITARPGIIAVDPNVIPLHSTVYVEFDGRPDLNGEYYAADTGGAIKGNIIDVFMYGGWNSFGRRGCTVYY